MSKISLITVLFPLALSGAVTAQEETPIHHSKILGGETASNFSEQLLPWQAAILSKSETISACGAVVIGERWLVTAAHCVDPAVSDTLVAGTTHIPQGNAYSVDSKYKFNIINKVVHEGYRGDIDEHDVDHDIALLEVDRSLLDVAKPIKIATLAEQAQADLAFSNTWSENSYSPGNLIASGWGYTLTSDLPPNELQLVKLGGIPDSMCDTAHNLNAESHFICADSNDPNIKKDVCRGDSGGPIIWQNPNYSSDSDKGLRVVGVTSYGPLCAYKNAGIDDAQNNGLYTELSFYLSWMESKSGLDLTNKLSEQFDYNPFALVNDEQKDKAGSTSSSNSSSSSSGGSIPLLGLVVLAVVGVFRRRK